ncbi:MAG: hypothetical protein L6408_06825 [Nanoarchaeota archaeon]|nr:hypothetical protein [Nanoarchaeota archaeon]
MKVKIITILIIFLLLFLIFVYATTFKKEISKTTAAILTLESTKSNGGQAHVGIYVIPLKQNMTDKI